MRNVILAIAVVGLIAVFGLTLARKSGQSNSSQPTDTNSSIGDIITIENNRFIPTLVRIKVGESITFISNDVTPHQLASDPHPTHTDYPPLNVGLLEKGQPVEVKFTTQGTFGFHDHLSPSIKGKVVVE